MFHSGILAGIWCEDNTSKLMQKSENEVNENHQKWSKYADITALLLFSWVFISTILQGLFGIVHAANFIIQILWYAINNHNDNFDDP